MEPSRHLELLRREGAILAATPADALDLPVPSVPDFPVERVLRHTGKVHRWVTAALAAGPDGDTGPIPSLPSGPACIEAYAEALDGVVAALEAMAPGTPVWTFRGTGTPEWWMRRQAHEVAVHRMDVSAAIAAGGGPAPAPLTVDGAADGVDEWITSMLAGYWSGGRPMPDTVRGTYHLHGTDDPAPADGAEWLVTIDGDGVRSERTHAKGDVALRGSAEGLLLAAWRRRPLSSIEVVGDTALAERLLDAVRL